MPTLSELLTGSETTLASILWPLMAGVILAACVVFLNKKILGSFVKRLLDDKICDEASAKTLRELGFEKNRFLRYALRPESTLRKMVKMAPPAVTEPVDGTGDTEPAATADEPRYYIPEDCAYRAEVTYRPDGSSILTVVIAAIVFIAAAVILLSVIPRLIELVGQAFGA